MYTRIIEYIPLMLILPCIVNLASAIMFTVVCIKQKRKLTNFKGILILPSVILILVGVVFVQFYYRSTIYITIPHGTYSTVIDDIELEDYLPYTNKKSRLETFNGTPNLVISSDYPKLDGATALYPVYAAIGKAIYEGLGVNSIEYFVMCSKTIGAYEKLINGEVDIIFVAQPSKQQEEMAKEKGVELNFTPIAREAFVFIVNRLNPVENLTIKQIQDIYTKKITNWKAVGGNDEKIIAFQRPENSGSQTAMLATVMKGKTLPKPVRAEYSAMEEMMGGLITRVADYVNYPASIGYSFRFFATEMNKGANIKLLAIEGILPTPENIANGTYPLAGDVYAVTAGTKNKNVELLLEWILSEQGQNFIEQCGYVKIK